MKIRFLGLLEAAGAVTCAATLFGFLGRFSWFLDLFSNFRVQYLVGLALVTAIFAALRRWRSAATFLAFAVINLALIAPLYLGPGRDDHEDGHAYRAMLLNVNTRAGDPRRVVAEIRSVDPDILVLEEISSTWVQELEGLSERYPHSRVQPREDNFGIGLYSKVPLADSEIVFLSAARVPTILATIATEPRMLRVIATHPLPPRGKMYSRDRNEQISDLPTYCESGIPLVLIGDLNVTPWNHHFRRLIERSGLKDSAVGFGVQPTWRGFGGPMAIPIDHCLYSEGITIVDRQVGADVGSDHLPLIVDLVIDAS